MSFAVIQTGGKQYKVSASEILKIERLNDKEGKTVEFKNVLFLNDDKDTEIGNPNIQGAKVEAKILKNTKNRTILVFKKRRRKNSRKKYGHRQLVSLIKITKIFSKNGKLIAQAQTEPKKTQAEAEPKKIKSLIKTEVSKEKTERIIKAEKTRTEQEKLVKKLNIEERKRLNEVGEEIKLRTKKSGLVKKKTTSKKKPLTTKKK